MALEAVGRIDALFDIEREINGLSAAERLHNANVVMTTQCQATANFSIEWRRNSSS